MSSSATGKWTIWDLKQNNVPANAMCTIHFQNISRKNSCYVGVREIGSTIMPSLFSPGRVDMVMVRADKYSKIEISDAKNEEIKYILSGHFGATM